MDPFTITLIFIVACTLIAAFVRRITIDKCLKDFRGNAVNITKTDGAVIKGKLRLESTGLELIYPSLENNSPALQKATCILYKHEYQNIQAVIRFHDELTKANKVRRTKQLQKTYHPNAFRRLKRKTANIFRTIRDSLSEVLNMLIARVKKTTGLTATLSGQDKYVNQMQQQLVGSVGTSYEPLLERYIGHKVIVEMIKADQLIEYSGILKDYTANFMEFMDVDYQANPNEKPKKADMVVRRQYGIVRHLGE